jgi:putative membrane protein
MMQGFFGGLCNGIPGYGPAGTVLSWLITLGAVALLVLLAIWLVRRAGRGAQDATFRDPAAPGGSAKEILQLRYARGEISREQYLQMRGDMLA